jgi:hypothetical protein
MATNLGSAQDRQQANDIATKDGRVVTERQFKLGARAAVTLIPRIRRWPAHRVRGEHLQMALLYLLIAYAAAGGLVAVAFVIVGVTQVQPMPVTVGARILLLPGAFVLWPFVIARWHKSRGGR